MKLPAVKAALALLPVLLLPVALPAVATEKQAQPPSTQTAPAPRPGITVRELASRPVPNLLGQGDEAKKNALAFIDWAGSSSKDQDEIVRKSLAGARENNEVAAAFCEAAFAAQDNDHSRALVALSLLGEMRSAGGMECMARFLRQPFPEKGTLVDGEIVEQTALATLQAKAIDGLAYLQDEKADELVVEAAAKHPSRIVRAEAIAAYLWNHRYDARSREVLKSAVRKDELIFLDRLVRQADEPKESFNRKLAAYLKTHPELMPPGPRKSKTKPRTAVGQPPQF